MSFTFFYIIGFKLEAYSNLFYGHILFFKIFCCFLASFLGFLGFVVNLDKINLFLSKIKIPNFIQNTFLKGDNKSYIFCFIFISLIYFFSLLAHFPGIVAYDVPFQEHFFNIENPRELHPLLHNLLILLMIKINQCFNSEYLGILFYSIFQSLTIVAIFSYCIQFLSRQKIFSIFKFSALLYFAFYPIHQILVFTTTKDVLFSGFALLFIILLLELILKNDDFLNNKIKKMLLIFSIFLMFCFRMNAFYVYLASLLFLFPFLRNIFKEDNKKVIILFLMPILLFSFFLFVKKNHGIKRPSIATIISTPLQQMGRVRLKYNEILPEEEKTAFQNIVSKDCELKYNPYIVDPLKIDNNKIQMQNSDFIENSIEKNPENFLNLYFKWAKKYPKDYINAFLLTNYTYWYPNAKYSKIYRYSNGALFTLFVNNENEFDIIANTKIGRKNLNPILKFYYDLLFKNNNFENNKFLFFIFSYAWNLWILIFCSFILAYKNEYRYLSILIFPLISLFVMLFGPVSLLRYVYLNYLILPIIIGFTFNSDKNN